MKLRLDPWPADYDAPVQIDPDEEARLPVNADVECAQWTALQGSGRANSCLFVDGVRRVEARVLADVGSTLVHGLFGVVGAGAVEACNGKARFLQMGIERLLILGHQEAAGLDVDCGTTRLCFAPHSVEDNHPNAVLAALQSRMRMAEAALAEQLAGNGDCVFVDGLSYRATGHRNVVGVVKRLMAPYVDEERFALLPRLARAERTPLFLIEDGVYPRYSCFVRIADPPPLLHPLAGIVRIETGAAVGLEAGRRLADLAAGTLPVFASPWERDPRAPQNLVPIGALEQELRRRLGDPMLIRRALERTLHEQRDR
jgi:hypothetical protein